MIQAQADDSELSFFIDSLRVKPNKMVFLLTNSVIKFRLEANSKDRIQVLNNAYKQIQGSLYPTHMKYLIATAEESKKRIH